MNLLLLHPEDRLDNGEFRVNDRRADHVRRVLGRGTGEELRAGLLNGPLGKARILADDARGLQLAFRGEGTPPPPLPLTLVLALPRPAMLHRALQDAASLGIRRIVLVHSARVEKSFWDSRKAGITAMRESLFRGLEQAVDTRLPELSCRRQFRPFVEDELPELAAGSRCLLAHPGDYPPMPMDLDEAVTLALGPEGGWLDHELDLLQQAGFECRDFGQRILRVETALPALVGRLMRLP